MGDRVNSSDSVVLPVSLRDWFAGQALAGIAGNPKVVHTVAATGDILDMAAAFSQLAYETADAMLATRKAV